MDYLGAFEVSASGMVAEKTRLEAVARNLVNINTSKSSDGELYKPVNVVTEEVDLKKFENLLTVAHKGKLHGVKATVVQADSTTPTLKYDPNHPHANSEGFVQYPSINRLGEMITLMDSIRAYEANVRALNIAKSMALKALEIGK